MAEASIHSDFWRPWRENLSCFDFFLFYLPWVMGTESMILFFWYGVLSQLLHSTLSLSSRGSLVPLVSAISVVSSEYLRLLIFLLATLIAAFNSSSPAFHMVYSAYKLNKQGDSIRLCCTSFPILNQSVSSCKVLAVASWPTYRFLRKQIKWSGITSSLRIFHSLLWSTQSKAFM